MVTKMIQQVVLSQALEQDIDQNDTSTGKDRSVSKRSVHLRQFNLNDL